MVQTNVSASHLPLIHLRFKTAESSNDHAFSMKVHILHLPPLTYDLVLRPPKLAANSIFLLVWHLQRGRKSLTCSPELLTNVAGANGVKLQHQSNLLSRQ